MKYPIIGLAAFVSLLGFSASAMAQSGATSFTYLEGSFQHSSYSTAKVPGIGEDVDGDGGRFELSLALHENVYIFGNYEKMDLDDISASMPMGNAKTWSAGLGFNTGLTPGRIARDYRGLRDRYSLFVNGQYLAADSGLFANQGYDDGFALVVGLRSINSTRFEFIASVGYEKIEGIDGELVLEGRLLYEIVKNLQIQFGADWNDNVSSLFLGLRYNFPGFAVF